MLLFVKQSCNKMIMIMTNLVIRAGLTKEGGISSPSRLFGLITQPRVHFCLARLGKPPVKIVYSEKYNYSAFRLSGAR